MSTTKLAVLVSIAMAVVASDVYAKSFGGGFRSSGSSFKSSSYNSSSSQRSSSSAVTTALVAGAVAGAVAGSAMADDAPADKPTQPLHSPNVSAMYAHPPKGWTTLVCKGSTNYRSCDYTYSMGYFVAKKGFKQFYIYSVAPIGDGDYSIYTLYVK